MAAIHPAGRGELCANGTRAGVPVRGAGARAHYAEIRAHYAEITACARAALTAAESVAMS